MFSTLTYLPGDLVLKGRLPDTILAEVDAFVRECRAVKDHPLAALRAHYNEGKNSFQVSVPHHLLEQSFTHAYAIHLGRHYLGISDPRDRRLRMRRFDGHFDGYDFWVNFAYIGDSNPMHHHAGLLSSVIYVQNDGVPTVFADGTSVVGERGDILMFPAYLEHSVPVKTTEAERITVAFNLKLCEDV